MRALWVLSAAAVLFTLHCLSVPVNRHTKRLGEFAQAITAADRTADGPLSADESPSLDAEIEAMKQFRRRGPDGVELPPNPNIERISFVGNRAWSNGRLLELLDGSGVKVGCPCDPMRNRRAATALEEAYHFAEYLTAKVELGAGGDPHDREVSFKIDEGPKVMLAKIRFTGNTSVPSDVLRLCLDTRANCWSSNPFWFPRHGELAIYSYYQAQGFKLAEVSHQMHFSPDRTRLTVEYIIEEGVHSTVRFMFRGNQVLSDEQLLDGLTVHEGDSFHPRQVEDVRKQLIACYRKAGLDSATVTFASYNWDGGEHVNLVYDIGEGELGPSAIRQASAEVDSNRRDDGSLAIPAEPEIRDLERLVFEGVESFTVAKIRQCLALDFETMLAGHPGGQLQHFLETLEQQIRIGYQHGGFPDATIRVVANEKERRIEVRVKEGERYRCGDVKFINAAPEELPVRMLLANPDPSAKYWKKGQPVSFDKTTLASMIEELKAEFAAAGFFQPKFEFCINRDPVTATADLVVHVEQTGPKAVVGRIEITGTARDSETDVLTFLDLRSGNPYDNDLPRRLRRRLWESGRYLTSDISESGVSLDNRMGTESRSLKIVLQEYDKAPPLAKELSPAERALVKLGEWLRQWSKGEIEEDIVVSAISFPDRILAQGVAESDPQPLAARPGETQHTLRMVWGPDRGQTLALTTTTGGAEPLFDVLLASYPDRLVLASPRRQVKVELPNPGGRRLPLYLKYRVKRTMAGRQPFEMRVGTSMISHRHKPNATAFDFDLSFSPAFMLSFLHDGETTCMLADGILQISNELADLQVEAATGRLVEYRTKAVANFLSLSIRTEQLALQGEFQAIDGVLGAATAEYDSDPPWKSVAEFLVDELQFGASRSGLEEAEESLGALRKLLGLWTLPDADEVLAELDAGLAVDPQGSFCIPVPYASYTAEELRKPGSTYRRELVAKSILPVCRKLLPRTGWWWSEARDAALVWASSDPAAVGGLPGPADFPRAGPVGEFLTAAIHIFIDIPPGNAAARSKLPLHNTPAAARNDYYLPLLKGDSWLGRWVLSLASALRELDEEEQRALLLLLPPIVGYEAVVQGLTSLKSDYDEPVDRAILKILDRIGDARADSARREP